MSTESYQLAGEPAKPERMTGEETRVLLDDWDEEDRLRAELVEGPLSDALDAIENFLRRYVAFHSRSESCIVALWVALTHIVGHLDVAPILAILSAEMRSGKTRLLEVLELLVARPIRGVSVSEAALFRLGEVTLLLDEVDAVFKSRGGHHEELRALLNAGPRRGALVWRYNANSKSVESFDAFGPKALAGIGLNVLPHTVKDRAIVVVLRRLPRNQQVGRFRYRQAKLEAEALREALNAALTEAEPWQREVEAPAVLHDRAAESWEPLLAIADAAGEGWRRRASVAAIEAARSEDGDGSVGTWLLRDIRDILAGLDVVSIPTAVLLERLHGIEMSPWGEWDLSPRRLADILRNYGIAPRRIRLGPQKVVRGYLVSDFEDAFDRYVPSSGPSDPPHRYALPVPNERSRGGVADGALPVTGAAAAAVMNLLNAFPGSAVVELPPEDDK